MRQSKGDLLDVNVWLALAAEDHVHHEIARTYWESQSAESIAFCRITMLSFLRLATNAVVMAGRPFTAPEAWTLYREFRAERGIIMAAEPAGLETQMAKWSEMVDFPARRWTDCALAGWAVASNLRIVSFDGDYNLFPGLSFLHLDGKGPS